MTGQLCICGCGAPAWRWRLGQECAHLLAGMCAGKQRYRRQRDAVEYRRPGRDTYRCDVCSFWHNGHAAAVTPELAAARAALLARLVPGGNRVILTIMAGDLEGVDRLDWKLGRERTS